MPDDPAHWVALNSIPGLGPAGLAKLLRRLGSTRRIVLDTPAERLAQIASIDLHVAERIVEAGRHIDKFTRYAEKLLSEGVRIVTQGQAAYPRLLLRAPNPPPMIYMAGSCLRADENSVGIIGLTDPSEKALLVGRECARRLAGRGCTIVSGYARGIDTATARAELTR